MLVLLIAVVFGLAIAYFATQNTTLVTIQVAEYALEEIPLYLVVVGTLFVGLFIAWILYFARSVSSKVALYGRDHAVKKARQTIAQLEQRVHELETENTQLKRTHIFPSENSIRATPESSPNRLLKNPFGVLRRGSGRTEGT